MVRKQKSFPLFRLLVHVWLSTAVLLNPLEARVVLRGGPSPTGTPAVTPAAGSTTTPASTAPAESSSSERLIRTKDALEQVRKMQQTARDLAKGSNSLNGLTPVDPKSWNKVNGLKPSTSLAWIGATIPILSGDPADITIEQTQQQAILNWETFNIGKDTTLYFDQRKGGTNASQWIAFNKVGVTGSPSQILGAIKAEGQVYVINPNGIIFGGSSQVNAHALVASSLPINDNLIQRGLLNNPDSQFLFSALPQAAGKNGTPAFTPVVVDEFVYTGGDRILNLKPDAGQGTSLNLLSASKTPVSLVAETDYVLKAEGSAGKMKVSFTAEGLKKIPAGTTIVQVAYTPTGDQYGKVEVHAGARLTAPTNADHVGGRVALIGKNVSNAGTISTPDGQAILAAGLQVAFAPHNSADPTLRGLDVFVGAVDDPAAETVDENIGTVTNERIVNADKTVLKGLIEAPRGAVTLTGKTVNQNGFIESSTSVAYNGRVDLVAGFNATANAAFDATATDHFIRSPFVYQSNQGNVATGETAENSGVVTLGQGSVLRIIPDTSTNDRVAGDLALHSLVNIQGQSVHLATDAMVLAPGATAPVQDKPAFGADSTALTAGVSVQAGLWYNPGSTNYRFVQSDDKQQIYFDKGAVIDVAGMTNVAASVTENIVSVELRGSELANSPLQRDGPLRGQTIQVDVRQHGPWDPALNGGLGGYTWVGTPLADTSGWIGLATHSVEQLTVNGGSVALKAGGAVVLQKDSVLDVSGGSIRYAEGETRTTKVSADGHIYDISQATPDRRYDGVYSGTTTNIDPKWGVTETTTSRLAQSTHEDAYTQGGNGGSLSIVAPVMALDGTLSGHTTSGPLQRTLSPLYNPLSPPAPANPKATGVPGWLVGASHRAVPSHLSLTVGRQYLSSDRAANDYFGYSPTPADIVFTSIPTLSAVAEAFDKNGVYKFPELRKFKLELDPGLVSDSGSGFGILRVDNSDDNLGVAGSSPSQGNITIARGTVLAMPAGGSLSLAAGNIVLTDNTQGAESAGLEARGGAISLKAYDISPSMAERFGSLVNEGAAVPPEQIPRYLTTRGNITVGSGATLMTQGLLVDNRPASSTGANSSPLITAGGNIQLNANNILLKPGSTLDVSGGGTLSATGKLTYGDAGGLSLISGKNINGGFGTLFGGSLQIPFGVILRGFAGTGKQGGKLSIQAPSVNVQQPSFLTDSVISTNAMTGALNVAPGFFNEGGFSSFNFTGLGVAYDIFGVPGKWSAAPAMTITGESSPNGQTSIFTNVQPRVKNWVSLPGDATYTAPDGLRDPAKLSFSSVGNLKDEKGLELNNNTSVLLGTSAAIATDPGGSVALTGGNIDVLGKITALGGKITITQNNRDSNFLPAIHLGSKAVLDASGAATWTVDNIAGYHKTDVLDGGAISVDGNTVAETGAKLTVAGVSDKILLPLGELFTGTFAGLGDSQVEVMKNSNGGTIMLTGEQLLFTDATLLGGAGVAGTTTARGGNLIITSNRGQISLNGVQPRKFDPVLTVAESSPAFLYNGIGNAVTDKTGKEYGDSQRLGMLWFGADRFSAGGFSALTLSANELGAVQVQGNVTLAASSRITVADGGVLSFVSDPKKPLIKPSLTLAAPYVKLGRSFPGPLGSDAPTNPFGSSVAATHGDGSLTVRAGSLIDVGTLVLQNTGTVTLDATFGNKDSVTAPESGVTAGAIRGDGTLNVAGDIKLKAGQIYPPTAVKFNVIADSYLADETSEETTPGSVTVASAGNTLPSAPPLSAGGKLNIYAEQITQGGSLRAPLGTIRLGTDAASGLNPLSGDALPATSKLVLQPGSVTSVSALDPVTGKPASIPYGINVNGDTWIDPTGTDITSLGPVAKSISLSAAKIDFQAATSSQIAATIDAAGGGDLSSYQFVPGTGGKTDILLGATAGSFAIVPGYADVYAPLTPYNTSNADAKSVLGGDAGYVVGNAKLKYAIGDRIHLEAVGDLLRGEYTLLPARYALLPGAYLVTPQTGAMTSGAAPNAKKTDGSVLVAGYRFNGFDPAGPSQVLYNSFEVASQAVVAKRAEYKQYSANTFFSEKAKSNDQTAPRLPVDAGRLSLLAGTALNLQGKVLAKAATGGRGGQIDVSSSSDIVIGSQNALATPAYKNLVKTLLLDAKQLSNYGAESLLIGGERSTGADGTLVTVKTNSLTVDNAGEALTGSDVILVANKNLVLSAGAEISQGNVPAVTSDPLRIIGSLELRAVGEVLDFAAGGTAISLPNGTGEGKLTSTSSGFYIDATGKKTVIVAGSANAFTVPAGSTLTLDKAGQLAYKSTTDLVAAPITFTLGDGALVRVSSDPAARILRTGVAASAVPTLTVGAGAKISGASAILDSTHTTNLASKIDLGAVKNLSANSGRVSVLLDNPGTASPTDSLVFSREAQTSLLKSATSLSLLSYSTLDLYGTGTFGSADLGSLALHAGAIRGFPNPTDPAARVTVAAKSITLDNAANATAVVAAGTPSGTLTFDTGTLRLGGNQLDIQNFEDVEIKATGGILAGDTAKLAAKTGGLTVVGGDLTITTPLMAGASATDQSIKADGIFKLVSSTGTATVASGLGAKLSLTGEAVDMGTSVKLPSGTLTMTAATGDLTVSGGTLDVSGTAQQFYDVTKYTDGGSIVLAAEKGDMKIIADSRISVAANAGGGSAGALNVSVPNGRFDIAADTLSGKAGTNGTGGAFSLDTIGISGPVANTSQLATLSEALGKGGFDRSVAVRVREGNVVADGTLRAHEIALAADTGKITVTGTLDASGFVGSTRADPFSGLAAVDPTGGKIDLSASGDVVLTKDAWLTAAGYAYSNAGKGGAVSLSAGSYTGTVDTAAKVEIQNGARLDLGVQHAFTPNDLLLRADKSALPVSNRTDFSKGTVHLRESQAAFGNGTQFSNIGSSIHDASGIVLEGFQVFDLTKTDGTVSTAGAITSIGSGGLIDSTVEKAVKDNGTVFADAVSPALTGNALFHVQPGAEIVNSFAPASTITRNFATLNSSVAATRSSVSFNLKPGNLAVTTVLLPGGLPMGITLKTDVNRRYTVTTADGVKSSVIIATSTTTIASVSAANPIVAVNFQNTGATALATQLNLNTGTTPVTVAFDAGTTINSSSAAGRYSSLAGDLTLANTWDLSTYRFGAKKEPGNLTLRAKGDLVFGFDTSLNDGFDPANPVDTRYPLWTAKLMNDRSWSYRLVGGADYRAADSRSVQSPGLLAASSGSVLLGQGGLPLPTATGNAATRSSIIPRYYQTIRTGTGDIDILAGRDVRLLNPLVTIYTAGKSAADMVNFDIPVLNPSKDPLANALTPTYPAQYSLSGGNLSIRAGNDIGRFLQNGLLVAADSSKEMPTNWLYRRGNVGDDGTFASFSGTLAPTTEIQSTTWWIDFSNFFSDVGTLGGGDVSLVAGRSVANVNAVAPTNARMPGKDDLGKSIKPDASKPVEFGGGNIRVQSGGDIDGGVYYVERGDASLSAGGEVKTNSTRIAFSTGVNTNPVTWLPTTFFVGKGRIDVAARGDVRLGQVANPFWLPQGANNRNYEATFFSTMATADAVTVSSLSGAITFQGQASGIATSSSGSGAWLLDWYANALSSESKASASAQPWLRLAGSNTASLAPLEPFQTVAAVMPGTLRAVSFSGDINLVGSLTLAPAAKGTVDLLSAGKINGLTVNGVSDDLLEWKSAAINLSDADPGRLPGVTTPISFAAPTSALPVSALSSVDVLFAESGRTNFTLAEKLALHGQVQHTDVTGKTSLVPLHYDDFEPVHLYATGGDLSGLTLYSAKSVRLVAAEDVTDIALYVQNVRPDDVTVVSANRDVIAYDPSSPLRLAGQQPGNLLNGLPGEAGPAAGTPTAGDIQIAGPGTLEVLAGRNLILGSGSTATPDGTAVGITSVGAIRNPYLPQNSGAGIVAAAGVGTVYTPAAAALGQKPGLAATGLNFTNFVNAFLNPDLASASTEAARYLPELAKLMGFASKVPVEIWTEFGRKNKEEQAMLVLDIFQLVLRNAARDRNDPANPDVGTYKNGFAAIAALFPGSAIPTKEDLDSKEPVVRPATGPWAGQLSMSTRLIKTSEGGGIALFVPGGNVTVGRATDPQKPDQGVLTERGGGISIFAADSVNVGTSRIFTLRGGNEILWSTWGNIAAGSGSKTVFSAPPTRVLIDPQSGDVQNDLAGLATGSGIGVLATLSGVKPGDVDLIAPVGTIDAGDAGIRSSGNLNIAARVVLNAANIQVGGSSAGTPPPPPAPTPPSAPPPPVDTKKNDGPMDQGAAKRAEKNRDEVPSLIMVEVLGYGGGDEDEVVTATVKSDEEKKKEEEEEAKRRKKAAEEAAAEPVSP